jgi:hypothetical protein
MAAKSKVTVSTEPAKRILNTTERRAAQFAEVANRQAELKREAAERRAATERGAAKTPPAR